MMRFVHDLQEYKDPQRNYVFVRACCWTSHKRDRKYKIKLAVQGGSTCKLNQHPVIISAQHPKANDAVM